MLPKIKSLSKHSVSRNAAALGVMQIANYAVPLLLLPFLTRQLGMEAFGVVAITLAAIQLAFVVTDYGFSLSATYSISTNRERAEFINRKISAIFGAKIILVGIIGISIIIAHQSISVLDAYTSHLTAAFIAIAAQAFQPIWLFQGIERMKKITLYTILSKTLYAALVLYLVSEPEDSILVIYCWAAAQTTGLVTSIYFMYTEGYHPTKPKQSEIIREFREGAQFFWSRLAVAMYTSASTLVVGSQSAAQAAQYSVCEQIYKAGQNVTSPINNAMFPYMAKHRDWKVFYGLLFIAGTFIALTSLILSFFAEPLLALLFGKEYTLATPVLLVFLCTTTINYFAVTFGYSAFAALGRIEIANITVIAGALTHTATLTALFFCSSITSLTVAITVLATESLVTTARILCFFYIKSSSSHKHQ